MAETFMPSLLDREIRSHEEDAFGHRHYSDALRSLIEDEKHVPPYSIGLLGTWGTGKSTIKEIYRAMLKDDASKTDGIERRHRIKTIVFNAWRHGGDDIKRALLRQVFLALGGSETQLYNDIFCQIERVTPERKPLKDFTIDVCEKWLIPILAMTFVLAIVAGFALWVIMALELGPLLSGISLTTLLGAVAYLLRDVFNFQLQPLSRYTPVTMIQPPSTTAEQYETLLRGQIEAYKDTDEGKKCRRIAVFVDDLDRLSADEMVGGLDAIRTFMDIPNEDLPSECGVVFVISCDEGRVAEALSRRAQRGIDRKLAAKQRPACGAELHVLRIFVTPMAQIFHRIF